MSLKIWKQYIKYNVFVLFKYFLISPKWQPNYFLNKTLVNLDHDTSFIHGTPKTILFYYTIIFNFKDVIKWLFFTVKVSKKFYLSSSTLIPFFFLYIEIIF